MVAIMNLWFHYLELEKYRHYQWYRIWDHSDYTGLELVTFLFSSILWVVGLQACASPPGFWCIESDDSSGRYLLLDQYRYHKFKNHNRKLYIRKPYRKQSLAHCFSVLSFFGFVVFMIPGVTPLILNPRSWFYFWYFQNIENILQLRLCCNEFAWRFLLLGCKIGLCTPLRTDLDLMSRGATKCGLITWPSPLCVGALVIPDHRVTPA